MGLRHFDVRTVLSFVPTLSIAAWQTMPSRIDKQEGGCQISIVLMSELLAGADTQVLYPHNALRNAAHLTARTPLIFHVDVDMLLSTSLRANLSNPTRCKSPQTIRVAAFLCVDVCVDNDMLLLISL